MIPPNLCYRIVNRVVRGSEYNGMELVLEIFLGSIYSTANSRLIHSKTPPIHTKYYAYPPFAKVFLYYLEKLTFPG